MSSFQRALIPVGIVLAAGPSVLLVPAAGTESWELELIRWLGAASLLLGWALRSGARRHLDLDVFVRMGAAVGPSTGVAGVVLGAPILLVLGLAVTVGVACRAGIQIGSDVHVTTLRRLED